MKHFRTGDFARKAGVTTRTLRYYDRVGLLKPSAYSESGQRLYTELDYPRLQQILTLKLIGLSLEEIKSLLTTDRAEIEHLLERQKRVLAARVSQLSAVIHTIETAQRSIRVSDALDLDSFIQIIKAVNMDWLSQFYTDEQKQTWDELEQSRTFAEQKQAGEAWRALFADIQQQMDMPNDDAQVQALVQRWDDLMRQFTHDDPDFAANLTNAYAHLGEASDNPQVQSWAQQLQAAAAFIQKVRRPA
jgi:MerR family transcriptional regulator, thiopeptide resistance regulator